MFLPLSLLPLPMKLMDVSVEEAWRWMGWDGIEGGVRKGVRSLKRLEPAELVAWKGGG